MDRPWEQTDVNKGCDYVFYTVSSIFQMYTYYIFIIDSFWRKTLKSKVWKIIFVGKAKMSQMSYLKVWIGGFKVEKCHECDMSYFFTIKLKLSLASYNSVCDN